MNSLIYLCNAAKFRAKLTFLLKKSTMDKEINQKLLEILVCPLSKAPLIYDKKNQELICRKSKLVYSIKNGIPIMIIDEARKLDY